MKCPVKARIRRAASGAALAALALTATGCGAINDQATTAHYDASDGISAYAGDLQIKNLMLVTNDSKSQARYLGTVINSSGDAQTLTITANSEKAEASVPADGVLRLEDDSNKKDFTISGNDSQKRNEGTHPGRQVKVSLSNGDVTTEATVPVVDGTLPEYADYVPGGHDEAKEEHLKPSEKTSPGH